MKEFQKDTRRSHRRRRPFVTLAYAQSIDGKIALVRDKTNNETNKDEGRCSLDSATTTTTSTSSNFAISGPESLRLTHALRSIHDAILIGGNTLYVDNPRLSNRLWPPPNECGNITTIVRKQPVPVILDTHLTHVRSLGINAKAKQHTIVCCSTEAYQQALEERYCDVNQETPEKESSHGAAKDGGVWSGGGGSSSGSIPSSVTLLPCKTKIVDNMGSSGSGSKGTKVVLDLSNVMSKLHRELGIDSLMVEGGASVLSQFAGDTSEIDNEEEEYNNNQELFDCLCVTISPKLLGANGLDSMSCGALGGSKAGPILGPLKCITLGDDCVLFADRQ